MSIVIIGAGHAGCRTAEALRNEGYKKNITLIGEEEHLPYERPSLSKEILSEPDKDTPPLLLEEEFYKNNNIDLRLGLRAEKIIRKDKTILLSDSTNITYDKLILATGLRPRRLRAFTAASRYIYHVRNLQDALHLKSKLKPDAKILIVGGGLLGLELAAAANKLGCHVTVTERDATLLARTVHAIVGNFVKQLHCKNGVNIMTETAPTDMNISRSSTGQEIIDINLSNGTEISVDLVIGAIGSLVNTELAETCGLNVRDGVIVNEYGQTSDEDIFAIGDISRHYNPLLGRVIRVESWHNAQNQAITVAQHITNKPNPYIALPWFWSDQFDMNLQLIGYPSQWDDVIVRGDPDSSKFTAWYMQGNQVVAANAINNGRDIRIAQNWISNKTLLDSNKLASNNIPLSEAPQYRRN